jgi:predicted translation initiation factor SUI1
VTGPDRTVLFLAPAGDPRGPAAVAAFHTAVKRLGLPWTAEWQDPSAGAVVARRVIVFDPVNARPTVEVWGSGDIGSMVNGLIATLLGGKAAGPAVAPPSPATPPKKTLTAKVGRETAGRKGKGVTTVFDLSIPDVELPLLAQALKNACGTGGTVKDGRIEIQGDQRDRVTAELEKRGFKVKRAGG